MEISRYTAKKVSKGLIFVVFFCFILSSEINMKTLKDSSKENNTDVRIDTANTAGEQHDNGILIKERQRTDEYNRYYCNLDFYSSWCTRYKFDTECKTKVCECKVRQGIFYFKLQSDGDEHPYSGLI